MRFFRHLPLVTVAVVLVSARSVQAESSNRNEVRANLDKGNWRVIWGKNFTEADWIQGTKAIAESIAAENPGPFLEWFGTVMEANFQKIQNNLEGVTRKDLERWIVQSLRHKTFVRYKDFRIEAGFATYNRWKTVSYDEPRTRKTKIRDPFGIGWTYGFETYMARVERKIPLPNWHQFYIRYQLVETLGNVAGGDSDPGPSSTSVRTISVGSTVTDSVGGTGRDRYRVQLQGGRTYSISVAKTSGDLDPRVFVRTLSSNTLAEDDDGGSGRNSLLTFRPSSSGAYFIDVDSYGSSSGGYRLQVTEGSSTPSTTSSSIPTLSVGNSITGTIGASGFDRFRVQLFGGRTYTIAVDQVGGSTDPRVFVRSSTGSLLAQDDDGGPGTNAMLRFRAPSTGYYLVDVDSYGTTSGGYRLQIR